MRKLELDDHYEMQQYLCANSVVSCVAREGEKTAKKVLSDGSKMPSASETNRASPSVAVEAPLVVRGDLDTSAAADSMVTQPVVVLERLEDLFCQQVNKKKTNGNRNSSPQSSQKNKKKPKSCDNVIADDAVPLGDGNVAIPVTVVSVECVCEPTQLYQESADGLPRFGKNDIARSDNELGLLIADVRGRAADVYEALDICEKQCALNAERQAEGTIASLLGKKTSTREVRINGPRGDERQRIPPANQKTTTAIFRVSSSSSSSSSDKEKQRKIKKRREVSVVPTNAVDDSTRNEPKILEPLFKKLTEVQKIADDISVDTRPLRKGVADQKKKNYSSNLSWTDDSSNDGKLVIDTFKEDQRPHPSTTPSPPILKKVSPRKENQDSPPSLPSMPCLSDFRETSKISKNNERKIEDKKEKSNSLLPKEATTKTAGQSDERAIYSSGTPWILHKLDLIATPTERSKLFGIARKESPSVNVKSRIRHDNPAPRRGDKKNTTTTTNNRNRHNSNSSNTTATQTSNKRGVPGKRPHSPQRSNPLVKTSPSIAGCAQAPKKFFQSKHNANLKEKENSSSSAPKNDASKNGQQEKGQHNNNNINNSKVLTRRSSFEVIEELRKNFGKNSELTITKTADSSSVEINKRRHTVDGTNRQDEERREQIKGTKRSSSVVVNSNAHPPSEKQPMKEKRKKEEQQQQERKKRGYLSKKARDQSEELHRMSRATAVIPRKATPPSVPRIQGKGMSNSDSSSSSSTGAKANADDDVDSGHRRKSACPEPIITNDNGGTITNASECVNKSVVDDNNKDSNNSSNEIDSGRKSRTPEKAESPRHSPRDDSPASIASDATVAVEQSPTRESGEFIKERYGANFSDITDSDEDQAEGSKNKSPKSKDGKKSTNGKEKTQGRPANGKCYVANACKNALSVLQEEAQEKRLAQELPGFNWLEEKIKNGGLSSGSSNKPQKSPVKNQESTSTITLHGQENGGNVSTSNLVTLLMTEKVNHNRIAAVKSVEDGSSVAIQQTSPLSNNTTLFGERADLINKSLGNNCEKATTSTVTSDKNLIHYTHVNDGAGIQCRQSTSQQLNPQAIVVSQQHQQQQQQNSLLYNVQQLQRTFNSGLLQQKSSSNQQFLECLHAMKLQLQQQKQQQENVHTPGTNWSSVSLTENSLLQPIFPVPVRNEINSQNIQTISTSQNDTTFTSVSLANASTNNNTINNNNNNNNNNNLDTNATLIRNTATTFIPVLALPSMIFQPTSQVNVGIPPSNENNNLNQPCGEMTAISSQNACENVNNSQRICERIKRSQPIDKFSVAGIAESHQNSGAKALNKSPSTSGNDNKSKPIEKSKHMSMSHVCIADSERGVLQDTTGKDCLINNSRTFVPPDQVSQDSSSVNALMKTSDYSELNFSSTLQNSEIHVRTPPSSSHHHPIHSNSFSSSSSPSSSSTLKSESERKTACSKKLDSEEVSFANLNILSNLASAIGSNQELNRQNSLNNGNATNESRLCTADVISKDNTTLQSAPTCVTNVPSSFVPESISSVKASEPPVLDKNNSDIICLSDLSQNKLFSEEKENACKKLEQPYKCRLDAADTLLLDALNKSEKSHVEMSNINLIKALSKEISLPKQTDIGEFSQTRNLNSLEQIARKTSQNSLDSCQKADGSLSKPSLSISEPSLVTGKEVEREKNFDSDGEKSRSPFEEELERRKRELEFLEWLERVREQEQEKLLQLKREKEQMLKLMELSGEAYLQQCTLNDDKINLSSSTSAARKRTHGDSTYTSEKRITLDPSPSSDNSSQVQSFSQSFMEGATHTGALPNSANQQSVSDGTYRKLQPTVSRQQNNSQMFQNPSIYPSPSNGDNHQLNYMNNAQRNATVKFPTDSGALHNLQQRNPEPRLNSERGNSSSSSQTTNPCSTCNKIIGNDHRLGGCMMHEQREAIKVPPPLKHYSPRVQPVHYQNRLHQNVNSVAIPPGQSVHPKNNNNFHNSSIVSDSVNNQLLMWNKNQAQAANVISTTQGSCYPVHPGLAASTNVVHRMPLPPNLPVMPSSINQRLNFSDTNSNLLPPTNGAPYYRALPEPRPLLQQGTTSTKINNIGQAPVLYSQPRHPSTQRQASFNPVITTSQNPSMLNNLAPVQENNRMPQVPIPRYPFPQADGKLSHPEPVWHHTQKSYFPQQQQHHHHQQQQQQHMKTVPEQPKQMPSQPTRNMMCNYCQGPAHFMCSNCHKACYCSINCQMNDWNIHSQSCQDFSSKQICR